MNGSTVKQVFALALLSLALPAGAATLQSLDDNALGEITGREGVIVGLEVYYNAQKSANAQLDGMAIGGTVGAPNGTCTGVVPFTGCRVALQLSGREARSLDNTKIGGTGTFAAKGEWLVFKDSYFALKMPDLYLDGSIMGGVNGAISAGAGYTGFFDEARFRGVPTTASLPLSGPCLLDNGAGTTACTTANIQLTPALRMHQSHGSDGNGTTSYTPASGISAGYDDISLSFKIGRMAVEYDTGACTYAGGAACGYNQDIKGSFLGVSIRDNITPFAGIAVGGNMYLYGF